MNGAPPAAAHAPRARTAKVLNGIAFLTLLVGLIATFALNDLWILLGLIVFFPLKALADGLRASAFAVGSRERKRATIGAAGAGIVGALLWGWLLYAHFFEA